MSPRIGELVGDEFFAEISTEQLQLVDEDVVIWNQDDEAGVRRAREHPLYRSLDVAREGRDLFLVGGDPVAAAYAFSTVLSLPFALDVLVPMLVATLDGDPATTAAR